jgi:hypothetical protein
VQLSSYRRSPQLQRELAEAESAHPRTILSSKSTRTTHALAQDCQSRTKSLEESITEIFDGLGVDRSGWMLCVSEFFCRELPQRFGVFVEKVPELS